MNQLPDYHIIQLPHSMGRLYVRLVQRLVLTTIVSVAATGSLHAQSPSSDSGTPPDGVQLRAGYELHRDHLRYTFENPSNIDTDFPVPHSFTQQYVADSQWLFGSPLCHPRRRPEDGIRHRTGAPDARIRSGHFS